MRLMIIPVLGLAIGGGYLGNLYGKWADAKPPVEKWAPSETQTPHDNALDDVSMVPQVRNNQARMASYRKERSERQKQNVADYLAFKGWKCGNVYGHRRHETNRIGLSSNEIKCLEKLDNGSANMRAYLITVENSKWNGIVERGNFDRRDRAIISALPVR